MDAKRKVPGYIEDMLVAIVAARQLRLIGSTLTLLYAAIDSMAYLAMPAVRANGKPNTRVNSTDFMEWVDKYLLPNPNLPLNSSDIYSARCGWVHVHGFFSSGTSNKTAKVVLYGWGNANPWEINKVVMLKGKADAFVGVHLDTLVDVFISGVERFFQDVERDGQLQARVTSRVLEAASPIAVRDGQLEEANCFSDEMNLPTAMAMLDAVAKLKARLREM